MTESDYQEALRNMPCHWCDEVRYGFVSWHHLICIHQSGTALKSPFWGTVPVCKKCHAKCHSYEISRDEQKIAMMVTWFRVGQSVVGEEAFWREMGESFAEIIGVAHGR